MKRRALVIAALTACVAASTYLVVVIVERSQQARWRSAVEVVRRSGGKLARGMTPEVNSREVCELDFRDARLGGPGFDPIALRSAVESLDVVNKLFIESCDVDREAEPVFHALPPTLESVWLKNSRFSSLGWLSPQTKVNTLFLSQLPWLTDSRLKTVLYCPALENLAILDCGVTGAALSVLANRKLRYLSLFNTKLDDAGCVVIASLVDISRVALSVNTQSVSEKGLSNLLAMPNLVHLVVNTIDEPLSLRELDALASGRRHFHLGLRGPADDATVARLRGRQFARFDHFALEP